MKIKNLQTILLLLACFSSHASNNTIALKISESAGIITVSPTLKFETSQAIKEAIDNGIRIQLVAKAQTYKKNSWWFDETHENKKITLEVFYFTLGKLYVVKDKDTGEQLGFNDYEQIWKGFEKLIKFQFLKAEEQNTWLKFRIRLDKGALPTVMQLPVLFNSNWDINTPWFQQRLDVR